MTTASDPAFAKIPPRVVAKALALPDSQRREYCQTLIGQYDYTLRHLNRIAREAVESSNLQWHKWRKNERAHLKVVAKQLVALRDA